MDLKLCVPVNPLCKSWNNKGECLTCFDGYDLIQVSCNVKIFSSSIIVSSFISSTDPNCFASENGVCKKCSFRFYFNKDGICTVVHPECKTWDDNNGNCLSCFDGFQLQSTMCQAIPLPVVALPSVSVSTILPSQIASSSSSSSSFTTNNAAVPAVSVTNVVINNVANCA